jgi:hypothetical protein
MGVLEIIGEILKFAFAIWSNRTDPEQCKLRAVATVTKDMNTDEDSFDKALAAGDANAIADHFQLLSDRVRSHTTVSPSGNP